MSKDARMPNETREVFLARLLLSVLDELGAGKGGALSALRHALANDIEACVRKGRPRLERNS